MLCRNWESWYNSTSDTISMHAVGSNLVGGTDDGNVYYNGTISTSLAAPDA